MRIMSRRKVGGGRMADRSCRSVGIDNIVLRMVLEVVKRKILSVFLVVGRM